MKQVSVLFTFAIFNTIQTCMYSLIHIYSHIHTHSHKTIPLNVSAFFEEALLRVCKH